MLKKSKGFTNVEMILVVGIISILSTVVYFIYDNASDKRQVSSEINNISGLINKIVSATTATDYKGLSNQALRDMGIYYQSEFKDFEVKGLSPKSFQVTYSLLNSRACSDLSMKTASMKGEYKLTRKINGADAGFTPVEVANACNIQQNKIELVFDGLNIQNIASVTPGTPKPPPNYAGEGTFTPDLPDRGDVPTNLADASKNTNNPSKPIPGLYKPPEYVVATSPTPPSGNASNPGGITVRPQYPENKPLGPLVTPPDNGNEWVPAVPPAPPRPPALAPPEPDSYKVYAPWVGFGYDGPYTGPFDGYINIPGEFEPFGFLVTVLSTHPEYITWKLYIRSSYDSGEFHIDCRNGYKPRIDGQPFVHNSSDTWWFTCAK